MRKQDRIERLASRQIVESPKVVEELSAILLGDCGESSDVALLLLANLATEKVLQGKTSPEHLLLQLKLWNSTAKYYIAMMHCKTAKYF